MKRIIWILVIVVVIAGAGFVYYRSRASSATAASASLQTATVQRGTLTSSLNAAGTVNSGQSAVITWQISGKVGTINAKLGDLVQTDQVLAVIDLNSLPPSMINARQSLIDAKKALEDVQNSTLQQAQALQVLSDAQTALTDLKQNSAEQIAQAQVTLATAEKALSDAQRKRNAMKYPHSVDPLVIENAETDYLLAKAQYKDALKLYNELNHKKLTDPKRAMALKNLLATKQRMNQAFAKYNWYLLNWTDNEIAQADAALALAQANLDQAQINYDDLKGGPDSVAIALAEAKVADAQLQWERIKDGPNPDDIAKAQSAVDAAQATLNQQFLKAPFGGTITDVGIKLGDLVSSGVKAFRIDDFSAFFVDLQVAEVDINTVKVGMDATLTFDAIPDKEYLGKVTEIKRVGTSNQGVVNYPVTVQITNPDEDVYPGMTAAVAITVQQHADVLMVPNQAIRVSGGQRTVTVLFEGQQISVPVNIGLSNATMSEVLGNQLKQGDEVVLSIPTTSGNNNAPGPGGFIQGFFGR